MKNFIILFIFMALATSCDNEKLPLTFKEHNLAKSDDAIIEINYPIASGDKDIINKINNSIKTTIATEMSLSEEILFDDLDAAITDFNKEYKLFIGEFPESEQKWEALVDSEVIYESPEVITVSISTYIDTGGAHGNTHVVFLNFDPKTGDELTMDQIIKDKEGFTELAIKYFKQHIENKKHDLDIVDSFYGKDFQLPETIGFTDEGVVILYNTYEIAAYAFGITEYEIPFDEISKYLNIH